MLSKHINPDKLIRESKDKKSNHRHLTGKDSDSTSHPYGARYGIASIPKFHIPSKGASAETTYQLIHDELSLDGSTSLNLASFVHTWMPEAADKLMMENMSKNLIDQDEGNSYAFVSRSLLIFGMHLRHMRQLGPPLPVSSEAIQLGGLAMKRRWQERRKAEGKSIHEPGPNIVMGANAQVALEKFARYFEVECRLVPVSVESKYRLDPKKAMEYVDENTLAFMSFSAKTGINVPIHGDGVSSTELRGPSSRPLRIKAALGLQASAGCLYQHLRSQVWSSLRGCRLGVEYSFSLNFSRPAAPIIAQYFNFIHLGFEGYRAVAKDDLENARLLSRALEKSGWYTVLSEIHRPKSEDILQKNAHNDFDEENIENYEEGLPVVAFRFSDSFQGSYPDIQQKWIQILLRAKGWIVPNYELAPDLEQVQILRVVVRENMTEALVDRLVEDIVEVTQDLIKQESPTNALNLLGNHSRKNRDNGGKMDEGSASGCSGTYAKPC
ncbi:pyridoxal phosphate-dependent transferase [Suillus subluteus]|nr:pyridoxal phosphate-dependent transferase [Suillus subluteus]